MTSRTDGGQARVAVREGSHEQRGPATARGRLLRRLAEGRSLTDAVFALVREGAHYERPIAERHRVIFYVGHVEAFDGNLLRETLDLPSFEPQLDRLFAFGIDPRGGSRPQDTPADWPKREVVVSYVERVRRALDGALGAAPASSEVDAGALGADLDERLQVAIEHRLMHAETLAYMLHRLPYPAKVGTRDAAPAAASDAVLPASAPSPAGMVEVPSGAATLGARRGEIAFGWDNEYEAHEVEVPGFAIDRFLVTNAEFLRFVEAGGYQARDLWSEHSWAWLRRDAIRHPAHWEREGARWLHRGMFETRPLPLSWPVYVSQAEATAYAKWAGRALPTEAQWHRAAYGAPDGAERPYPWGTSPPRAEHGNFAFRRWDPAPVHAHPAGASAFGVHGLLGNGWEWTASVFAPFPGFAARPCYPGYSADFFDGEHFVLKGGSSRTASCFLRRSFRNWFQPHYPHVYAGFRCVAS